MNCTDTTHDIDPSTGICGCGQVQPGDTASSAGTTLLVHDETFIFEENPE